MKNFKKKKKILYHKTGVSKEHPPPLTTHTKCIHAMHWGRGGRSMKGLCVACPVHLPHTVPLSFLHRYRLQKGTKERGGPERKHSQGDPRLSPAVLFEKGGALDACASPAHTPQKGSIPTLPTVLFR